jgi:hypothetical protein
MEELILALDHPESEDLSWLTEDNSLPDRFMAFQSPTMKAILMSFGVIVVLVFLAVLLQSLRP